MTAVAVGRYDRLTPALSDLMEHERVIEQGLQTFVEVGNALVAIRDDKKYRAAGFSTFETYCSQRWGIRKSHAYRLMEAADTAGLLSPMGDIPEQSKGSHRGERPGCVRSDTTKKAVACAYHLMAGGRSTPYALITSHMPLSGSVGDAMLRRAVQAGAFTWVGVASGAAPTLIGGAA